MQSESFVRRAIAGPRHSVSGGFSSELHENHNFT